MKAKDFSKQKENLIETRIELELLLIQNIQGGAQILLHKSYLYIQIQEMQKHFSIHVFFK